MIDSSSHRTYLHLWLVTWLDITLHGENDQVSSQMNQLIAKWVSRQMLRDRLWQLLTLLTTFTTINDFHSRCTRALVYRITGLLSCICPVFTDLPHVFSRRSCWTGCKQRSRGTKRNFGKQLLCRSTLTRSSKISFQPSQICNVFESDKSISLFHSSVKYSARTLKYIIFLDCHFDGFGCREIFVQDGTHHSTHADCYSYCGKADQCKA